tara:strand:- start:30 stop:536 length:507 start_codon:yes stop_codon:yes gene_type:complete
MLKEDTQKFDAPIPGMAMTGELGGKPWQTPPQFSTVEDTIDYYMSRMATDEFEDNLIEVLKLGVSVTAIANTMQTGSVMEGVHSIDVGILVTPIIMEFIMLVADAAGIDYDDGMTEEKEPTAAEIANILKEFKQMQNKEEPSEPMMEEPVVEEEVPEEEPTGLMARRN